MHAPGAGAENRALGILLDQTQAGRPVHVEHAFANLNAARRGAAVDELVPESSVVRSGEGWSELELGRRDDLLFAVRRLDFDDEIADDTAGRFQHGGDLVRLPLVEAVLELDAAAGRRHDDRERAQK